MLCSIDFSEDELPTFGLHTYIHTLACVPAYMHTYSARKPQKQPKNLKRSYDILLEVAFYSCL